MNLLYKSGYLVGFALGISSAANSHPHDNPLVFRQHLTDDGRVIFSNIEKRCFSNGKLTCLAYHPIWKGGLKPSKADEDNTTVDEQKKVVVDSKSKNDQ